MLFTDAAFLFYFLPLSLIAHRFTVGKNKNHLYQDSSRLVLFSLTLLFYAAKEPWWLFPFSISIFFDFVWASLLKKESRPWCRKLICTFSIIQNLGLLGFFKYWSFIEQNLMAFFSIPLPHFYSGNLPLSLPAGISFYTFESMSFVIDVYRREVEPPKKPLEFFSFIGMFPRFVAGPIVRYKQMVSQFHNYRGMQVEAGLFIFLIGLFLKCGFADNFAIFTRYTFDRNPNELEFLAAWTGVFAYTMQIYFDFSGYSLMAIGLGRCFGFQFPSNFNCPYHAKSLQDFWRRWHISLSSWLRDYLYLPLGGSRGGRLRMCFNLFLTMVLGGLWHGSSWTYVMWGVWHGGLLCLERLLWPVAKLPRIHQIVTFILVLMGWVFFRANSLPQAFQILRALIDPLHRPFWLTGEGFKTHPIALGFCTIGIAYGFLFENRVNPIRFETTDNYLIFQRMCAFALGAVALILCFSTFTPPFLYFQF